MQAPALESPPAPPSGTGHSKRRQYAAGQTQAYYGGAEENLMMPPMSQPPPQAGMEPQLFTPGLAATSAPNQFAMQQGQTQPAYYDPNQGQQQPDYINGQQPSYGQPNPNALADQFGQMGLGSKPFALQTANLLTSPPDPRELSLPPPEIRLPPNSTVTPSPLANADPSFQRSTLNAFPNTSSLLSKSKIPLALIISPYRTVSENEPPVPLVTDTVIARCRRCRTYINPFVQFIDGGNRWRCCMCNLSNEVPQMFDWDQTRNQPGDRWSRPELSHGAVEYVAPTEYMVRPPQPAVYVFLIDVSHAAVQSGLSCLLLYASRLLIAID